MILNKTKKAELTNEQIVILIILIVSFAVLLFFLYKLNLGKTTSKEICHNSVMLKGATLEELKETVSLNCDRSYICITEDSGGCKEMYKPEIVEVKNLDEIYQKLADEMANCWWMFGEGRVDYIGGGVTKGNYCSICSQILFDTSLNNIEVVNEGKISKDNLYDYMSKTNIPGKEITYSEYIFGTTEINQLKQLASQQYKIKGTFGNIEVGKQYFVVMGITNEVSGLYWAGIGAGGVGAVIGIVALVTLSNPVGWVGGAVIIGVGAIAGATGGKAIFSSFEPEIAALKIPGKGIPNNFTAPTILEVDSEKFKALNCEEILTFT